MGKLIGALLLVLAPASHALDGNTEQRCKDIDALGGANSCVCSEPLITNGPWRSGFWNPPGSITKECGGNNGGGGNAFYLTGQKSTTGFIVPSGNFSVPAGSGVPFVFLEDPATTSSPNQLMGKLDSQYMGIATNAGRVCHRAMIRLSPDFIGRNSIDLEVGCTGSKINEMNPSGIGPQYQGGFDDIQSLYYSGPHTGSDSFTNLDTTLQDCKTGWCGFEQCWQGNFATGAITPIARTYVVGLDGTVKKDSIHVFLGSGVSEAPVPVQLDADRILNLYKQGICPGSRAIVYAMEAIFAMADDGSPSHGPWIGPPVEFTGGDLPAPNQVGAPGRPTLMP